MRHAGEIRSEVPVIADWDFANRGGFWTGWQGIAEQRSYDALQFFMGEAKRIEIDEQGSIRGMQIANTRILDFLDRVKQSDHLTMGIERNFIPQTNEEGRIAGRRNQHAGSSLLQQESREPPRRWWIFSDRRREC